MESYIKSHVMPPASSCISGVTSLPSYLRLRPSTDISAVNIPTPGIEVWYK
jgi:hypothetical protein